MVEKVPARANKIDRGISSTQINWACFLCSYDTNSFWWSAEGPLESFVLETLCLDGSKWCEGMLFLRWFFSVFLVRKKIILWSIGSCLFGVFYYSFLFVRGKKREEKSWHSYKQKVEGKLMGAQKRGSPSFYNDLRKRV